MSNASAGALLTLSKAVVGDARLRLPGPQLVRGVSNDVANDAMAARDQAPTWNGVFSAEPISREWGGGDAL